MSLSSNTTANVMGEVSYSSSSDCPTTNKRSRHQYSKDSNASNCASHAKRSRLQDHQSNVVSSSKFKGVVSQMNGHWGAQIYTKHQRIWLGTFISEKEAAMAYDSAAIKLRSGDSFRNFPWTSTTAQEPNFQTQFSTELVLSMIKDGSYPSKFAEYLNLKHQIKDLEVGTVCILGTGPAKEEYSCRQLFQKELTPSDVGKLNRLVIPKKSASKYFSHASDGEKGENADDVQLVFYDTSMRLWKFRYCYWKSSQSYVFTRGWNKFVKEKGLKAKDTIIFSLCQCNDGVNDVSSFGVIDVSYSSRSAQNTPVGRDDVENNSALRDAEEDYEEQALVLELGRYSDVTEDDEEANTVKEDVRVESVPAPKKGFRLFGVQIS